MSEPRFGPYGSCPWCGQFNCTTDHDKELQDKFAAFTSSEEVQKAAHPTPAEQERARIVAAFQRWAAMYPDGTWTGTLAA